MYPGEGSQRLKRQRKAAGRFALPASHYQGLVELAKEVGMEGRLSRIGFSGPRGG